MSHEFEVLVMRELHNLKGIRMCVFLGIDVTLLEEVYHLE